MKTVVLLLAFCALACAAEAKPSEAFKTTGGFFAVSVAEMASSVAWYQNALGLDVVMEQRQGGIAVTVLSGGGLTVELLQIDGARPLSVAAPGVTEPQMIHGVWKAGFFVKDFDRTVEELRARGVQIAFGPFPANGSQKANVIIRDNAGNLLQVFGD